MPTVACETCGQSFEAQRSTARFCSAGCRKAANRGAVNEAEAMKARARELTELQKRERGTQPGPEIDGKRTLVPGPYVPTPEREARAREIIGLRKRAARTEHPIRKAAHAH